MRSKANMTGKKVLLVDDDPDIQDAIKVVLESKGYQVISARNGKECLEKLEAEEPDLMILDLLMPIMDGFAVYKEFNSPRWAKYHHLPILILSSIREEASRRRYELETGQKLDVDQYLEKPISPYVLLSAVEKLLEDKQPVKNKEQ
jgi:two-component system response regulator VicR